MRPKKTAARTGSRPAGAVSRPARDAIASAFGASVEGGAIMHHSSDGIFPLRRSKIAPLDTVFVLFDIEQNMGGGMKTVELYLKVQQHLDLSHFSSGSSPHLSSLSFEGQRAFSAER